MVDTSENNNTNKLEQVLAIYLEGGSDVEVARFLKLSKRKLYEFLEENPNFADLVERGRTFSEAWWYEKGRTGLFTKEFNAGLYALNMKNRYGWADKVDTAAKDSSEPLNQDQMKGELMGALTRLARKDPDMVKKLMEASDGK